MLFLEFSENNLIRRNEGAIMAMIQIHFQPAPNLQAILPRLLSTAAGNGPQTEALLRLAELHANQVLNLR